MYREERGEKVRERECSEAKRRKAKEKRRGAEMKFEREVGAPLGIMGGYKEWGTRTKKN